jgi:transcriptional antiterminator RfaH
MSELWYVLRSKPNKEDFLWGQLQARGIECFYPRTRVRTVNPRARKVRPYFPGYLFIHVDLEETGLSALQWMPGASGLVAFGGQPASVPDTMINAIRNRVDQVNVAGGEVLIGLKKGETITIRSGPFDGYEAIFDTRLSGNDRVRVLLNLINRQQLPVELPSGHIQRKPSPNRWPA